MDLLQQNGGGPFLETPRTSTGAGESIVTAPELLDVSTNLLRSYASYTNYSGNFTLAGLGLEQWQAVIFLSQSKLG